MAPYSLTFDDSPVLCLMDVTMVKSSIRSYSFVLTLSSGYGTSFHSTNCDKSRLRIPIVFPTPLNHILKSSGASFTVPTYVFAHSCLIPLCSSRVFQPNSEVHDLTKF